MPSADKQRSDDQVLRRYLLGSLPAEEAERMVAALRLMMHAATALMTYNFQRMVLAAAQRAVEKEGSPSERAALKKELERRRVELAIPA